MTLQYTLHGTTLHRHIVYWKQPWESLVEMFYAKLITNSQKSQYVFFASEGVEDRSENWQWNNGRA